MLADEDPIYVLEGVIVDPNSIDMDNIETVNVLKGPNATALYGTRAQYGAVVMTLKKGSKRRVNVELNSTVNVDMIARTMKFQNEYGGGYEGESQWRLFSMIQHIILQVGRFLTAKNYVMGDNAYADESWGAKLDGREYVPWYAWWQDSPYYGTTAKYEAQPNNIKDFYNKALTLKNTISVSGGNEFFQGRLSFTNLDQNGTTPYTYLKRNYLSYNGTLNFSEKLSLETMFNFTGGKVRGEMDDTYGNQTTGSFNSWFSRDLDIKKLKELKDLRNDAGYHASWNWWGADYYPDGSIYTKPAFWLNPYFYMESFDDTTRRNNYSFLVAPTYEISRSFESKSIFFDNFIIQRCVNILCQQKFLEMHQEHRVVI